MTAHPGRTWEGGGCGRVRKSRLVYSLCLGGGGGGGSDHLILDTSCDFRYVSVEYPVEEVNSQTCRGQTPLFTLATPVRFDSRVQSPMNQQKMGNTLSCGKMLLPSMDACVNLPLLEGILRTS